MNLKPIIKTFLFTLFILSTCFGGDLNSEYVILLHGLARTHKSMAKLEKHLINNNYKVLNLKYPSTSKKIEEIAEKELAKAIDSCRKSGAEKIHFVTHSMGGIVVRYYLEHYDLPELGRVVMLSPPNNGSEVVDKLKKFFIFKWLNGPAGQQLGTDKNSMPQKLGKVDFDLGIITGDRTINFILSFLIPGPDDGKVSVKNAQTEGMKDFIVIHSPHPFIMKNSKVIMQTIAFLKNGEFIK